MALPPEPLQELLLDATQVVVAEVAEILSTGPTPAAPSGAAKLGPGATSVGYRSAAQRVRLKISRVLKGPKASELVVDKPEAAYLLAVGNHGPFFVRGQSIIGRYGPDTHRLDAIERALGTSAGG